MTDDMLIIFVGDPKIGKLDKHCIKNMDSTIFRIKLRKWNFSDVSKKSNMVLVRAAETQNWDALLNCCSYDKKELNERHDHMGEGDLSEQHGRL